MAVLTTARITALRPGQSPPPVRTPRRLRGMGLILSGSGRADVVAVHAGDEVLADFLRADGGAFAHVGAAAEAFGVHLTDHAERAAAPFRLALWEKAEVGDLGGGEKHRRGVRAGGDA